MTKRTRAISLTFLVFTQAVASCGVMAAPLVFNGSSIGTLTTVGPAIAQDNFQGGVNFWARWTLDGGQTALDPANLRWLQLTSFSKAVGSPFPDPPRPFVDPLSSQKIGIQKADGLPWYEVTGTTQAGVSVNGRGTGAWLGDAPSIPWTLAPVTFTADTFVVLITDAIAKQARILGGVQWGYSLDSPTGKHTSLLPVVELADSPEHRMALNAALAFDYPGWLITVPEPSSRQAFGWGAAMLCVALWIRNMSRGANTRVRRNAIA